MDTLSWKFSVPYKLLPLCARALWCPANTGPSLLPMARRFVFILAHLIILGTCLKLFCSPCSELLCSCMGSLHEQVPTLRIALIALCTCACCSLSLFLSSLWKISQICCFRFVVYHERCPEKASSKLESNLRSCALCIARFRAFPASITIGALELK